MMIQKMRHGRRPVKKLTGERTKYFRKQDRSGFKLRIIPLGGLEEVGRNCALLECGNDIIIVDMGLQFPEDDMPGIDYVIPNFSYLRGKEDKVRGVIITHGHYDHIGAVPHLMSKIGNPIIYTSALTAGMIQKRQSDFPQAPKLKISIFDENTKIKLGENFTIEPFRVNHNIPDSFGLAIYTPFGLVIHTGDFKFDYTPINDKPVDFRRLALLGSKKVLALLSDSTNAGEPGHQISERQVGDELMEVFVKAKGRIIIGTFASLLTRTQQILNLAEKMGRKAVIEGRSMRENIEIAYKLGYLKINPETIIDADSARKLPHEKIVIICTGAQGEESAALMRIANNEHKFLKIIKGDTVVFSSSIVPGNERTVQHLKDTLVRQGAKVIHYQMMDVHAGGHAKQEDLKLMLRLIQPEYFVPIQGNRFLLELHAEVAEGVGIKPENIFVANNGQVIEFDAKGGKLTEEAVPTDYVMVDGLGVGDSSSIVLRDRRMLAEDGMFVVIVTIDTKSGVLVGNPDIISRGFVYLKENKKLIEKTRSRVKMLLRDADPRSPTFEDYVKNKIRNDIGQYLFSQTKKRPMILPVLIEV